MSTINQQLRRFLFVTAKSPRKDHMLFLRNFQKCSRRFLSCSKANNSVYRSDMPDLNLECKPLGEYMMSRFERYGDKSAMVEFISGRRYTYAQLKSAIIKVGSALTRMGYKKGDVIDVHCINAPEFGVMILGAVSIGVIVTTSNPAYTAGELARQLETSTVKLVVSDAALVPVVKAALKSKEKLSSIKDIIVFGEYSGCKPFSTLLEDDGKAFPENVSIDPINDVCFLPYSSGTTGLPKGVMLSHFNIVANLQQLRSVLIVTKEDNALAVLPFFHAFGLCPVLLGVLHDGGNLVTLPKFEPELFLSAIQNHKISLLHAVPPMVLFMAKHPAVLKYNVSSLKSLLCAAAPLGLSLSNEFKERFDFPVRQGYGMTEAGVGTHVDRDPPNPGTAGRLLPNTLTKVINSETGEHVEEGNVGEICMKGPQIMLGYLNNKKATDETIKDGWLHSGDLGYYVKETDAFVITGRLKELIKYKAFQVAPAELEDLILKHPGVQDVAVIGIPDEGAGELPRAYVVKNPSQDVSAENIIQFVDGNVAPHKKLRGGVEFIDQIPKTASGKILRRVLKESIHQSE